MIKKSRPENENLKKPAADDQNYILQIKLKKDFLKNNLNRFNDIVNALESGDIKTAHRFAHTLKSNAAMIGKDALRRAAEVLETALNNGFNLAAPQQINAVQAELSAVLDELGKDPELRPAARERSAAEYDPVKAMQLFAQLQPLLESGNPECLKKIDELDNIPGSDAVKDFMEDFHFGEAAKALSELKIKLGAS